MQLGWVVLMVPLLLFGSPSLFGDNEDTVLTGEEKTEHFDIRYRPDSRAAASVERTAFMAERDYDRITTALNLRTQGRFVLCLYDDVPEMDRITGTSGSGGFSGGNRSHLPYDNDQTRLHEMVHILAVQIPHAGDEPRNLFFAEGLANAVLEFVHGVHVHAVAAFYRKRKELPPLAEMTGAPDFYAWLRAHPGINAYDVAASWIRFLLDSYGPEKVKRYYTGMPAKTAFGADDATLEKAWHGALDGYVLRPEVDLLLRQRAGEKVEFPPWRADFSAVKGRPGDWTALDSAELRPDDSGTWVRDQGLVRGHAEGGEWRICEIGNAKHGDAAVRATVEILPGCGAIQVRLGPGCQGMLVANGTFVWRDPAGTASNPKVALSGRSTVDITLVRRGGQAEVWIDGKLAVSGPCGIDQAPVGIGFVNGTATFREIRVRGLTSPR